jgi:hypothetical protein
MEQGALTRGMVSPDVRSHRFPYVAVMGGIFLLSILSPPGLSAAQDSVSCLRWGQARQIGQLDPELIPEASGLAVSSRFPDRFYHVDDSSATIFLADPAGQFVRTVRIRDTDPIDVEDLALGPCGDTTCLFIADIGDNALRRDTVEVLVVEERAEFPPTVSPRQTLRLRYPDGPHDAEALGVQPDGDILVISRNFFPLNSEAHAELFRVPVELWTNARTDDVLTLEHVASIELRGLASELPGRLISAMDVSEDNRRLLALTYANALEFDLASIAPGRSSQEPFVEGMGVRSIALEALPQQEGIAYLSGDRGFVYTTEAVRGLSPTMRVDCASPE